jgi:thiamine kinase-like enzyme
LTNRNGIGEDLSSTRKKIERYVRGLPPEVLGAQNIESVEVLEMTPGAYNLNYHVRVNDREFIFRVNIEQQSGLPNQIEYEFKALKFLEGHHVAPKVYYYDDTRERFDFGILIEEYLEGPYLSLESEEIPEIAGLLVRLHSLALVEGPWIVWKDPLVDNYEQARRDLINYEAKETAEKKVISLAKRLLAKTAPLTKKYRHLFRPDGMNHTDVVRDNIIKTSEGMRLIDWEKPRIDDCTYDLGCFLCEPAQLWCTHLSPKVLTREERENFLKAYVRLSGKKEEGLLLEKVRIREPLIALHWVLWGANKLCDLRDGRMAPELVRVHEEKRVRYERTADPGNIERLLESC